MTNVENIKCAYTDLVELHKLVPHARNSNNHPEKQIDMLSKIIDHLGQRHPIIVSKRSGYVVAGHGRLLAMQKLGWNQAAVDYQDFDSEASEFQFLIADNKIAELAEHDDAKMLEGIKELKLENTDFEIMGLRDFEIPEKEDVDYSSKNKELDPKEFESIEVHTCPNCGFKLGIE